MASFRSWTALLLVAATTLFASPSAAQESSTALAEALFRRGRELMEAEKLPAACAAFAKSYQLEKKVGSLLNLAVCNQKLGRTATAWAHFESAIVLAQRAGQGGRADYAARQAKALERTLSTVTITALTPPPDVTLNVDGEQVDAAAFGTPLPLDPGDRFIEVSAPGKIPWSTTVTIPAEKTSINVEVPALTDEPPQPKDSLPPSDKAAPPDPWKPAPTPATTPLWSLIIAGGSVAGAGLLVGAITGGVALGQASDLQDACDGDACRPEQRDTLDETLLLSNVSNVAFVVAGLGAAAALVGLFIEVPSADVAVGVSPAGLTIGGTF